MGFIIKMTIMGTMALIIMAKMITPKNETEANQTPESTVNNIVNTAMSGIKAFQQAQESKAQPKRRICKIKPNGDEECKDIQINDN